MIHVNYLRSKWGISTLFWAIIAGGLAVMFAYTAFGVFVTGNHGTLMDKLRPTGWMFMIGIIETLIILGTIIGLFFLVQRISKRSSREATKGWVIILTMASLIFFCGPMIIGAEKGIDEIKTGLIHNAALLGNAEGFFQMIFLLGGLLTFLGLTNRGSGAGFFHTLFSGTLTWTLAVASYVFMNDAGISFAWVGPLVIVVIMAIFYFIRPITSRRKSIAVDFKRLKELRNKVKKEFKNADLKLIDDKFTEAKKAKRGGSFTGMGYDRAMNRMEEAFQTIYDALKSYFSKVDSSTKEIVEVFGTIKSLKNENAKVTELEASINKLEKILDSGDLGKAKDKAVNLKRDATELRDRFTTAKEFLDKTSDIIDKMNKLGAKDKNSVANYDSAKDYFSKGVYDQAREKARSAYNDGNETVENFESAKKIMEELENRIGSKASYKLITDDLEERIEKAKKLLKGVSS